MPEDGPTTLQGEDLTTWVALATLVEWLPSALDAQLQRDAGLTHFEYGLLYALAHAPDRTLRMSVLAGYAHSSLSRLSRAATRLERRDWVRRSTDPTDGRYTLATLTAAGSAVFEAATPGHVRLVHEVVLDVLSPAQARQLRAISGRITEAIGGAGTYVPAAPPEAAAGRTAVRSGTRPAGGHRPGSR